MNMHGYTVCTVFLSYRKKAFSVPDGNTVQTMLPCSTPLASTDASYAVPARALGQSSREGNRHPARYNIGLNAIATTEKEVTSVSAWLPPPYRSYHFRPVFRSHGVAEHLHRNLQFPTARLKNEN